VRTFLPTQFCPQSFCPHFAHTIIKKKSKFGVHVFVNKQDFRGLGDFLWAKCVGKMKMCGQNKNMKRARCECRWLVRMSLEKSPKSFRAKFPRQNCGQNVWAKCVGKLWANLGQEMLYDGDISGDDEYTLETLQAAAVEILGSPSGKDEDFNYLLEIMDQQFEDSNPGAARRPQLLLAPLSVSVCLAGSL
jgi:hypothetical protein